MTGGRCWNTYTTAFDRHESFEMEYRFRRHDGEYRWIIDFGVPRFNPDGSLLAISVPASTSPNTNWLKRPFPA